MANTLRYNNTIPSNIYYGGAAVQNVYYNNTKVWSASRPFSFTYTGAYETEGNLEGNFIIRFKTSGTLTITSHGNNTSGLYDVFAVGGGAGGGSGAQTDKSPRGGCGGYTNTKKKISAALNTSYNIIIGSGGAGGTAYGSTSEYYGGDGGLSSGLGNSANGATTVKSMWGDRPDSKTFITGYGGSSSNKAILRIVDLNTYETSIKSASTSIMYSDASCYVYKNYALMLYGTGMYKVQIDSSPDTISSLSYYVYNSSHNVLSGCIFNDKIYVLTQSNSTDSSNYFTKTINVADISNISSTSTITFTNIGLTTSTTYINYTKNKVYMCMYNNTIYCFCGMNLMFTFDLNTNEFIELQQSVSPYGYSSSQSVLGYGFKSGKVFFLGIIDGNITTSKKLTDVAVYDIASNTTSVIKNVFGDNTEGRVSNYTPLYGYCQDENDIFILGGSHTTSSDIKNEAVTKYTIQSNNYDTGTIICQPTAAGDHITTMYSSDLVTLNYGIDAVYYQDTNGFKKQDAAIIKNGVVTNL